MNKSRILIVEDEIIIAMEIADRLKAMGYEVIRIVSNGEMAVKTANEENPDLILMDIMIQGPIDGIETATKIHLTSDVPVIYLTANADESTLERAKISDAFGYLIKPFEEKELNTTIEMALYKHRMEAKLRESEERFKSLVENSSIGIFRFSTEGMILHANPTFLSLLGYKKLDEINGRKFDSFLIGGVTKQNEIIKKINENNGINRYKVELLNKERNKILVSLSGNLIQPKNEVQFYDGTIEDITLQQKYEEQLIKAKEKAEESDKLKTEFLAGMSHEIRTPINTIMSYLSLLNEELNEAPDSSYKEIFSAIQIGSLRLTRTIDSILNMAQFQAGTFDVFKTKIDIVDEVIKSLYEEFKYTAKQRGLELKFENTSQNTSILGDKYSLSQLFVNLIDNGLKYTREGSVKIKIYNNEEGVLSVDISDTGIGISQEFLPTLFKPFTQEEQGYTRKFDGNGLGLALVKRYCDLNDAVIKVESEKGTGTKFTIKFTQTSKQNEYKQIGELKSEQN
ncbi:MAG: response regulator [Ignavibacteriae bacterium]|nr:response regulator [Ignavibacteriota bacterium]MCB9205970.1 response regulator [Ignavibacteriales bacterium]MCB9209247.1 response regulator [Ignavibacteriales bacterium]MCB9257889.1 response regulator [Ignavibacteriales bacterium]